MHRAGLTSEEFTEKVEKLKALAYAKELEVFPELWIMANVCSDKTAQYIAGLQKPGPFVNVKRHIDRWDQVKKKAKALIAQQQKKPRPRTYTVAVADALERAEPDEQKGHFDAVEPWVAITGVKYPEDGTPSERLGWYRHEHHNAQLVEKNHLKGESFVMLVTLDNLSEPYAICRLRCPHCGRTVTDAAQFSPLASQEEYGRLKLADLRGQT